MKLTKLVLLVLMFSVLLCGCRGSDSKVEASSDAPAVTDEGVGTFYYPDAEFNNYASVKREFDGTPQGVVDILYQLGNYGNNVVKVNTWSINGDTMYIDFDDGLFKATGSTAQEYFSVMGTVKTLKSCFDVTYVSLTVNGNKLFTEHAAYDGLL